MVKSFKTSTFCLKTSRKVNSLPPIVFLSDDGISGLTFERPAMSLMLKLVNDGRVKRIIVKDLSRFGRDDIQVKTFTQMIFPAKDVQFIAINDSVDTAKQGADTMISLKSMINDMHSRDLSEKERQAYQIKGNRGLPTYPNVHYGYIKAPDYKESKMWVVEEESAAIVRRIFHDYPSGKSQWAIARTLREEKILTPSRHYAKLGVKTISKLSTNPYYWGTSTVGSILRRYEYCGHLINFKTYSKSYKLKKRLANSPDKIKIFRDHHEAIIDEETFNLVKIKREREHHPRLTKSTPIGVFNGLVYCADCGSHHNFRGHSGYYYCKGSISRVIQCPSAHGINEKQLTEIVLREISKISKLVIDDENALAQHLRDKLITKEGKEFSKATRQLREAERRLEELDAICRKLLESNAFGQISDAQFCGMNDNYQAEREGLAQQFENAKRVLDERDSAEYNMRQFLKIIKQQLNPTELSPIMVRKWIERIEVGEKVKLETGKHQEVKLFYRFVGEI